MRRLALVAGLIAAAGALPAPAHAAIDKSDNVRFVKNFKYTGGTDLDFQGKYVYAGQQDNAGGIRVYDVSKKMPKEVAFIACPGTQNDVAVVKPGLLALGYHAGHCGGPPGGGVRLIDVRNPKRPRFLGSVDLPGGTHTLTVYPGKPVIYASPGGLANGGGHEQILDVSNPNKIEVASTFRVNPAGCHDVSFHISEDRKLAFCAGLSETQIWDVSDPFAPLPIGHIPNLLMFFQHSAVASPDGNLLAVGDEAFAAHDCVGGPTGSVYLYDITVPSAPVLVGHIGPARGASQTSATGPWCTAHNFNWVPGTRTLVTAWYSGGTTVHDLSTPSVPQEIAHFRPDDANVWSSYYYRGRIYANDGNRGLDVLEVKGLEAGRS